MREPNPFGPLESSKKSSPEILPSTDLNRVLHAVEGVNRQFLSFVRAEACLSNCRLPFSRELSNRFARLTLAESSRLARCGVLLVDAGFADQKRWEMAVADGQLGPTSNSLLACSNHWCPSDEGFLLAQSTLMVAFLLVHWRRMEALLLLGMTQKICDLVAALGVDGLNRIARLHPYWIRPRWVDVPQVWQELLELVHEPSTLPNYYLTLRCVQLCSSGSVKLGRYVDLKEDRDAHSG